MALTKRYYRIKPLIAIILLVPFSSILKGQGNDPIIKDIREAVQKINIDKSLKSVKLENEQISNDIPDGGCSLTGYFKGKVICKMDFWVGLSYCIRQYSLYLNKKGAPVFIYETEQDFPENKKGGLDYDKIIPVFEARYYLQNGKTIDIRLKGKKRLGLKLPSQEIADLLSNVKLYKKLLSGEIKN